MPSALASLPVLLTYLFEAVVLLTLGILLANILVETGIFSRMSGLMRTLCRISGLSHESTTSLLAIFINPTAGKAMDAGLYYDERSEKRRSSPRS